MLFILAVRVAGISDINRRNGINRTNRSPSRGVGRFAHVEGDGSRRNANSQAERSHEAAHKAWDVALVSVHDVCTAILVRHGENTSLGRRGSAAAEVSTW